MAANEAVQLNGRLDKNQRILLSPASWTDQQQAERFIAKLASVCCLRLAHSAIAHFVLSDGGSLCIREDSRGRMSKVWLAVQEALRERFDSQWGPVFVSGLRWPGIDAGGLADRFDPARMFAYTVMEAKVKQIEMVARSLGQALSFESIRDAAVLSRPHPAAPPTPRDLSRCGASAEQLVLLLVRSDRVACLAPLCESDAAADLLRELAQLMNDLTALPLNER